MEDDSMDVVGGATGDDAVIDLGLLTKKYSGHMLIRRAIFIAENCAALAERAYTIALKELKKTSDVKLFRKTVKAAGSAVKDQELLNLAWAEKKETQTTIKLERLESNMKGYETNMIKESIRIGCNELGDVHFDRGDFSMALRCYVQTKDNCYDDRHVIEMCLNVIRSALHLDQFAMVQNYVNQAFRTDGIAEDACTKAKLRVAAGLSHFQQGNYRQCSVDFVGVSPELGDSFADIIHHEDIATYGSLCGLASMGRAEIRTQLLGSASFKSFLDLAPAVRQMVTDFVDNKFGEVFRSLDDMLPALRLDLLLAPHLDSLYKQLRERTLLLYFSPYSRVRLSTMSEAFRTPQDELRRELLALISSKKLDARIDTQFQLLVEKHSDSRALAFKQTKELSDRFVEDMEIGVWRSNMLRHGICCDGGQSQPSQGGRMMGTGLMGRKHHKRSRMELNEGPRRMGRARMGMMSDYGGGALPHPRSARK